MKVKWQIKVLLSAVIISLCLSFIQKRIIIHGDVVVESILQSYFNDRISQVIQENQKDIMIDQKIDAYRLNEMLYDCVEALQKQIKDNQQQIITTIPIGSLSGFMWLQDIGFHIPIRYKLIERVRGKIDVETTELGINNTLIQVNLNIEFTIHTSYSWRKKELVYNESLLLAMEYIQGEVPHLYAY